MAKSKKQKEEIVNQYREALKATNTVYMADPSGLSVNEVTTLKKELNGMDSTFNVVKNTLFEIALKEEGLPKIPALSKGQNAVLFSSEQVSETAKLLVTMSADTKKLEIGGGLLNGEVVSAVQIKDLASLPSKEVLLGQLLNVMNGPIRGFVTVAQGNTREVVQVLNAIKEKKEESN